MVRLVKGREGNVSPAYPISRSFLDWLEFVPNAVSPMVWRCQADTPTSVLACSTAGATRSFTALCPSVLALRSQANRTNFAKLDIPAHTSFQWHGKVGMVKALRQRLLLRADLFTNFQPVSLDLGGRVGLVGVFETESVSQRLSACTRSGGETL